MQINKIYLQSHHQTRETEPINALPTFCFIFELDIYFGVAFYDSNNSHSEDGQKNNKMEKVEKLFLLFALCDAPAERGQC